MGFLNENDSLAYYAILGELSPGLSFTIGFFKAFDFLLLSVALSRGQEGHTSQHLNISVGFRRPNIRIKIFLAFCTKFERHSLRRRLL